MIFCVASGSGTVVINGVPFSVGKGSFGWLQAYHMFRFEPQWGGSLELICCAFDYASASYVTYRNSLAITRAVMMECAPVLELAGQEEARVRRLFTEFLEEGKRGDASGQLMQYALFLELTSLFLRYGSRMAEAGRKCRKTPAWDYVQYLFTYSNENLTLQRLADEFKTTPRRVSCELKLMTGESFSELLERARINRACDMMHFGGLSMRYIVYYTGFHSETAFYRSFRRVHKMTPAEYREQFLNGQDSGRGPIDASALVVLHYIFCHYREPVTILSASRELFLEKNSINPLLKNNFGADFQQILTKLRMIYAEGLIRADQLSVADAACACGYSSPHTFIRIFKGTYGVTPGEYRNFSGRQEYGVQL